MRIGTRVKWDGMIWVVINFDQCNVVLTNGYLDCDSPIFVRVTKIAPRDQVEIVYESKREGK